MRPTFDFDAASALSKGRRSYQEDAIISDFARGTETGLVVLADGMGGHAAGDIASKIVVTEVFSELLFQRADTETFERNVRENLHNAAMAANTCLKEHVRAYPETDGMGATLVACAIIGHRLYWISIGDSPLYLFRDGVLEQLNEDHSMAPQIDFMVKSGLMPMEEAARHPDRSTLTSVLFGAEIPKIDCPKEPTLLQDGDIVVVASDGLQFLSNPQIQAELRSNKHLGSDDIVDGLLQRVSVLEDPDQDNVSFCVVKMRDSAITGLSTVADTTRAEIRRVG